MKRLIYFLFISLSVSTLYAQGTSTELSHYLLPEFTQGTILMKDGKENKALLNYNSLTEEMIFNNKGQMLAIGDTELAQTDSVFIGKRTFILLNGKFVELLAHSTFDLYAEHKCDVIPPGSPAAYGGTSQTSSTTSYSSLATGGRLYDLKLPDDYTVKPYTYYWIRKNGELNKFISLNQLMKLNKDKKDLFKAYVKKNDVKFDDQESIIQLIEYLEKN